MCILFVDSSCRNEAHEVVRKIAAVAMEELKKQKPKSIAKPH
jgi:hypothetical protein